MLLSPLPQLLDTPHGDTFGLFTQPLVSSSDKDRDLRLSPYHYRTLSIWQNLQPVLHECFLIALPLCPLLWGGEVNFVLSAGRRECWLARLALRPQRIGQ